MSFALSLRRKIGNWVNGIERRQPGGGFSGPMSQHKRVLIMASLLHENARTGVVALKKGMKELCPQSSITLLCEYDGTKNDEAYISADGDVYFCEGDVSFFFKIKNEAVCDVLRNEYDICVFLATDVSERYDYVSSFVKAKLRVAVGNSPLSESGLANFILSPSSVRADMESMPKEIVSSLKMMFG